MQLGRHQWEQVIGSVTEIRLLHPNRSAPHAKIFVVRLHPQGREPVTAEVHYSPGDRNASELYQPSEGDVRGFLYDPRSGKAEFDMKDERNSWTAQNASADALMEALLADQPATGGSVTGPPWIVPAHCPSCGAAVGRARAEMEIEPQCGYCGTPLPVEPRARF